MGSDSTQSLYALRHGDVAKAGAVLKDAFSGDPVWNRLFAGTYVEEGRRQAFFEVPVLYCLRYGRVYAPSPALEGVAAWMPGELADMRLWRMIRSGAIRSGRRLGWRLARKLERVFARTTRDRAEHMRGVAYTYLQIIGVAAEHQGRGFGGRLLRSAIEHSERAGRTLYLETETEANVGLYEKFGFRTLSVVRLPEIDLPFWEMARDPSGSGRAAAGSR